MWWLGFVSCFLFYLVVYLGIVFWCFCFIMVEIYFVGVLLLIIILVLGLFVGVVFVL